jgi:hypothetical protein
MLHYIPRLSGGIYADYNNHCGAIVALKIAGKKVVLRSYFIGRQCPTTCLLALNNCVRVHMNNPPRDVP